MSGPAISPAPPASPGANALAGSGPGAAAGAQGKAHGGATGFEAMLTSATDDQAEGPATAPGAPGPAGVKTGDGAKAATDGKSKAKTAADGSAALADAATDANANGATAGQGLALQMLPVPYVPLQATQLVESTADGADADATTAVATGDKPGAQGAGGFAKLTAGAAIAQSDADKAQIAAAGQQVAASVGAAAADATANAKAAPGSKANTAPTPQTPAPPAAQIAVPAAAPAPTVTAEPVVAAALPATPAPQPSATEPTAPVGAKDAGAKDGVGKAQGLKPNTRVDATKVEGAPAAGATPNAKAADALQPLADIAANADPDHEKTEEPVVEAKSATAGNAQPSADPATASTTTPATLIHAAAVAVRGAPQTVANLAAQIIKKLEGRSTQFDIQLDPAGLGKVDVRLAIGADGRMSAAMSFDTPQAAAELKSRANELQRAMEQAGFDVSGGMSFDVASDRGQGGQAQNHHPDAGAAFRGRAFQAALDTTADIAPPPQLTLRRTALAGVDIRI